MSNLSESTDSRLLGEGLKRKPKSPRNLFGLLMTVLATACIILTLIPLFALLFYVAIQGLSRINFDLFTKLPHRQDYKEEGLLMPLLGL